MFEKCKDEESVKKLFKRLAFILHPDKGGENDLMVLLKDTYEKALDKIKTENSEKQKAETHQKKKEIFEYEEVVDDVKDYDEERLSIIDKIRKYALKHPKFKMDFTESVVDFMDENGFMTSCQYNKLVKIYYSFRMDVEK